MNGKKEEALPGGDSQPKDPMMATLAPEQVYPSDLTDA
jgi:hypothetical protein